MSNEIAGILGFLFTFVILGEGSSFLFPHGVMNAWFKWSPWVITFVSSIVGVFVYTYS